MMEYHGFKNVIDYKLSEGYNNDGISVEKYSDDDISEIGIGYHPDGFVEAYLLYFRFQGAAEDNVGFHLKRTLRDSDCRGKAGDRVSLGNVSADYRQRLCDKSVRYLHLIRRPARNHAWKRQIHERFDLSPLHVCVKKLRAQGSGVASVKRYG